MSQSREDIIEGACRDILDHWEEWEQAAEMECTSQQTGEPYEEIMLGAIRDVIKFAFKKEDERTDQS